MYVAVGGFEVTAGMVGLAGSGSLVGIAVVGGWVGFEVSGGLVDANVADGLEVFFSGVGVDDDVEDPSSVIFTSLVSSEITGAAVAAREELLVPASPAKIIGVLVLV